MQQLALELSQRPAPTLANFATGRNAELLAVLSALAQGCGPDRFVYLWGAVGSGRSHLLQAVTHAAAALGRASLYVAAAPAAGGDIAEAALLAVDDIERLDAAAQRSLFGVYNRIREAGGTLVASGCAPPSALGVRADLATRLAWGLVYEVHALNDDDKAIAMSAHARGRGFDLPLDAREYLLRHAPRDLPSLLMLVDALDRYSLERSRAITLPLVREVLRDVAVPLEQR
ncbi:MAG: DnaA regulatory inactivator Hda [Burkholderiales bacterium]|nr:DnaA regulatory inactivator Hda [Burkholderiales bacterium]